MLVEGRHKYNYIIPDVNESINILLLECRNETILNIYIELEASGSPLINEPNRFIKLCPNVYIIELFNLITRKDLIDYNILIGRNSIYNMCDLYTAIVKSGKDIPAININQMFNRCHVSKIFELYQLVSNKEKIDVNKIIKKCIPDDLLELYKYCILIKVSNQIDANLLIHKCKDKEIVNLCKLLVSDNNINKHRINVNKLFNKCDALDILEVYMIYLSYNYTYTNLDINMILRKCQIYDIVRLYRLIPNKQDVNVNKLLLNYECTDILKLFKLIPNKQDVNTNIILEKCDSYEIVKLYQIILNCNYSIYINIDLMIGYCD